MSTDFTQTELHRIREMLTQRYRKEVEVQLADCELSLDMGETEPMSCPTVFWHERDANFVVFKISPFRFRSQFFYSPHEQYGTGIDEFNDLDQRVAALLQTQSDHEREHRGMNPPTENT
ncbi:MAG: hypothetical protein F4Z15_02070 [Gammaproteobacteria bacterium]|nr:hypothetical protein [Gammaproteobacteria bacterium]MYD76351.1 hypothetical protein [Gammaproteobacteria bacterium]MYJ51193.1 hypothetical protein [Gammaproteobacteria bacterium]